VSTPVLVAAGVIAIVVASLVIWVAPHLQVARWRRAGITNEEKLAELGLQGRTAIIQALGGLALIVTIALTAYQANQARRSADRSADVAKSTANETQRIANKNLRVANKNLMLAEQGQNAERFSRAIEELGATNARGKPVVDVRVGALFSLESLGLHSKSESDAEAVFRVAAAYVADNYEQPKKFAENSCSSAFRLRADIRIALSAVLREVANRIPKDSPLRKDSPHGLAGLRGALLDGLVLDDLSLSRFDLRGIKLRHATLARANFRDSDLSRARFERACLQNADFSQATLIGTRFDGADLKGAQFKGATFNQLALAHARKQLSPVQLHSIRRLVKP
jgi:Pentapeptide repeats (8 copies)